MLRKVGEPVFPGQLGLELYEDCRTFTDSFNAGQICRVRIEYVAKTAETVQKLMRERIGIPAGKSKKK